MLRYIQLFFSFILFAALISCSVPATSSRKPIFASEEEIFKDMTWSGSTGQGTTFYVSMKNGKLGMQVITNSQRTQYNLYGKSSLSGNTWKGKFQHPTDPSVIYDVKIEIESEWKATGSFVTAAAGYPSRDPLYMSRWESNSLSKP